MLCVRACVHCKRVWLVFQLDGVKPVYGQCGADDVLSVEKGDVAAGKVSTSAAIFGHNAAAPPPPTCGDTSSFGCY